MNKPIDSISNFDNININKSNHPIIEIHVSCKNLIKLDVGSQSDPFCIFMTKENGKFAESQRTETIYNNPNPNFVQSFKTYYIFESDQPIRFEVFDADTKSQSTKSHDFIGYVETSIQHLMTNLNQALTFELKNDHKNNKRGEIIISTQQSKESNTHLQGIVQVVNLKKMKTFSKNSPFFEISKPTESGRYVPVYRSEVKKKCNGCTFKEFEIPLHALVVNNLDEPITVTFYDYRNRKPPKQIGCFELSVRQFMETLRTKHEMKNEAKTVGTFWFNKLDIVQIPTFIDYLNNGLQLNLITAIDFTFSNGPPNSKSSLHYISKDGNSLNQYQQCIYSVGSVVTKYDSTQKFTVFGFGADVNKKTNHCFPLTFNENNMSVDGLDGILNIYKDAITKVEFSGPTFFEPVITKATQMAIDIYNESKTYSILLILTDGMICDMKKTKNAIIEASDKPLSIIIVGVGDSDFDSMEVLDADDKPLVASDGTVMKRDIVQFVPFNKYKKCSLQGLEREVLAEIPKQVHKFCSTHGFVPVLPEDGMIY